MSSVISFITPKSFHAIYQDKLVFDEFKRRGWNVLYNSCTSLNTHLFCTSNSQFKRTNTLAKKFNIPYITWIADIGITRTVDGVSDMNEVEELQGYLEHVRVAWKAISICTKMQWKAIHLTGKYRIDLVRPCIDNHTIAKVLKNTPSKKNQIVVVGAMAPHKQPHIPFLAWKELPKPRPKLIYLSYGFLDEKARDKLHKDSKRYWNKESMAIKGCFAPQLIYEASKYPGEIEFRACDDINKFKIIAESKLLVMADAYGGFNLPPIEAYFCGTKSLVDSDHSYSDFRDSVKYFNEIWQCSFMMNNMIKNPTLTKFDKELMEQYTIENCCNRLEKKLIEYGLTK